jgi:hypothetical protein
MVSLEARLKAVLLTGVEPSMHIGTQDVKLKISEQIIHSKK